MALIDTSISKYKTTVFRVNDGTFYILGGKHNHDF